MVMAGLWHWLALKKALDVGRFFCSKMLSLLPFHMGQSSHCSGHCYYGLTRCWWVNLSSRYCSLLIRPMRKTLGMRSRLMWELRRNTFKENLAITYQQNCMPLNCQWNTIKLMFKELKNPAVHSDHVYQAPQRHVWSRAWAFVLTTDRFFYLVNLVSSAVRAERPHS